MTPNAGRLAPSPTGGLHLGHARTFLLAWVSARQRNAPVFLRIEDIDTTRCHPEWATGITKDLAWLGLNHDGVPLVQTTRLEAHWAALETLKRLDLAYPCTCTRSEIARAASAPHGDATATPYPGTCAGQHPKDATRLSRPYCWRFRMPAHLPAHEELASPLSQPLTHPGDPIIWRADRPDQPGGPSYHLAVVVDDAFQGVGEIVRGEDLLSATPIHRALQVALRMGAPRYAHVPLMKDQSGRRLAKRDGASKLLSLRSAGISPETLVGQLAASAGMLSRPEPARPDELVGKLDWEMVRLSTQEGGTT